MVYEKYFWGLTNLTVFLLKNHKLVCMNDCPVYELTRDEEESIAVAHPRIKRMVERVF